MPGFEGTMLSECCFGKHSSRAIERELCTSYNKTVMDILLSKYGLIFTEFESIDLGSASVNTVKFSKYQTIFTE